MKDLELITIDGTTGEGGGQILRSSLALSLVTGKAFRITGIRAGRRKPGLARQHLTAVKAAAEVGKARVMGAELRSTDLTFVPRSVHPGEYHFAVGTAGSAILVLQTVLPALLTADGPSNLVLEGGTHNAAAPPFEFLDQVFLPQINRMGPTVTAALQRPGFEPAGGGRFTVEVQPSQKLEALELLELGEVKKKEIRAVVAHLDNSIAEKEMRMVLKRLRWEDADAKVERADDSTGPGNVLRVTVRSEHSTQMAVSFGRIGVSSKKVAHDAAQEMQHFLSSGAAVGRRLADQLLLPMALAGGGRFTTPPLSKHSLTQIDTIGRFLDVAVTVTDLDRHLCEVKVETNTAQAEG